MDLDFSWSVLFPPFTEQGRVKTWFPYPLTAVGVTCYTIDTGTGKRSSPTFRSAIHAAAPHNAKRNIGPEAQSSQTLP